MALSPTRLSNWGAAVSPTRRSPRNHTPSPIKDFPMAEEAQANSVVWKNEKRFLEFDF